MLTGVDQVLVPDLAAVDRVGQEILQLTVGGGRDRRGSIIIIPAVRPVREMVRFPGA